MVTAAHCVFDINDSRQYVSSLNFAPGESSQNSLPYGTAQWSSVRVLSQFTSQVYCPRMSLSSAHSSVRCETLASLHPVLPSVGPQCGVLCSIFMAQGVNIAQKEQIVNQHVIIKHRGRLADQDG